MEILLNFAGRILAVAVKALVIIGIHRDSLSGNIALNKMVLEKIIIYSARFKVIKITKFVNMVFQTSPKSLIMIINGN
jgi:hypothetical protein